MCLKQYWWIFTISLVENPFSFSNYTEICRTKRITLLRKLKKLCNYFLANIVEMKILHKIHNPSSPMTEWTIIFGSIIGKCHLIPQFYPQLLDHQKLDKASGFKLWQSFSPNPTGRPKVANCLFEGSKSLPFQFQQTTKTFFRAVTTTGKWATMISWKSKSPLLSEQQYEMKPGEGRRGRVEKAGERLVAPSR